MVSTVFVDKDPTTPIVAAWLNDVNAVVYGTTAMANANTILKVALIGDSMSAQNAILGASIGETLERRLNAMGVPAKVYPCNRDGHTFFRANTVPFIGGHTAIDECISHSPDVVIFLLGINDSLLAVDGRSLAQIKTDADTALAAVRAALPLTQIIYVSQKPFDDGNFTPTTCKNKGIPSYFHKLNTAGILTGYYTNEVLESVVAPATQTGLANWIAFDAYLKANGNVNRNFTLNLWKVARLGGCGNDGVHLNPGGVLLGCGYLLNGLRGIAPFGKLYSNNFQWWEDPDYVFSQLLTASGDGYTYTNDVTSKNQNILSGGFLRTNTWYLPVGAELEVSTNLTDAGSAIFHWTVMGADPLTQVKVSVNGGAFVDIAGTLTNSAGFASAFSSGADTAGLTAGSNILRYAVGNICLSPKTIVYGAYALNWNGLGLMGAWAAVGGYAAPASYLDQFKVVRLRGLVTGGANLSQICTLPVGKRPPYPIFLTASATGGSTNIQINTNGDMFANGASVTNITLDGLSFPTA